MNKNFACDDILKIVAECINSSAPPVPMESLLLGMTVTNEGKSADQLFFRELIAAFNKGRDQLRAELQKIFSAEGVVEKAVLSSVNWARKLVSIRGKLYLMLDKNPAAASDGERAIHDVDLLEGLSINVGDKNRLNVLMGSEVPTRDRQATVRRLITRLEDEFRAEMLSADYVKATAQKQVIQYQKPAVLAVVRSYLQERKKEQEHMNLGERLDAIISQITSLQVIHQGGMVFIPLVATRIIEVGAERLYINAGDTLRHRIIDLFEHIIHLVGVHREWAKKEQIDIVRIILWSYSDPEVLKGLLQLPRIIPLDRDHEFFPLMREVMYKAERL